MKTRGVHLQVVIHTMHSIRQKNSCTNKQMQRYSVRALTCRKEQVCMEPRPFNNELSTLAQVMQSSTVAIAAQKQAPIANYWRTQPSRTDNAVISNRQRQQSRIMAALAL